VHAEWGARRQRLRGWQRKLYQYSCIRCNKTVPGFHWR
jgi:hypothetical protein